MRIIKATSSTMTDEKINRIRSFLRVIEIFEVRLQVASYRGQSLSGKIENILQKMTDDMEPKELVQESLEVAGDVCIYNNKNIKRLEL